MSLTKRIFSNVFWLALSEVSSRGLIFLGIVYLARVLGTAGFGLFSLALAVGIYSWAVSDMGVTGYGTREIAKNKEKALEIYCELNSLRFIVAFVLFILFSGILALANIPLEKKLILSAGAFYAVAFSLSSEWVFRGLEKMQYLIFGRLASALFFLGGIFLLVKTSSDIVLAPLIYSSSFLIETVIFMMILRNKLNITFSLKVSYKRWKYHLKDSIYFAFAGALNNTLTFAPVLIMGLLHTNEELGIFSGPHRISMMSNRAIVLFFLAFYPTLSSLFSSDRTSFKSTFLKFHGLLIWISMPICIITTLFARELILLLFGVEYINSIGIFHVFIWVTFLSILRRGYDIALFTAGLQKHNMLATCVGTAVVIITGIVLIHYYKGYGAAWSLILGEISILIILTEIFRRKIDSVSVFIYHLMKVLLAGVAMVLLILLLPFPPIMNSIMGVVLYGVLLLSMGIISMNTIRKYCHNILR